MPFSYGDAVFTSSAGGDIGGGRRYTRFKGPLLVGQKNDNATGGPTYASEPPHLANVSSSPADIYYQVGALTSAATRGFVYISQVPVSVTSSDGVTTMVAPVPPTGLVGGVALLYDSARKKLCVYSTADATWLAVTVTSS